MRTHLLRFLGRNRISNLADLGCAAGALLTVLRANNYSHIKHFGFDLSQKNVELAKQLFPGAFFRQLDITTSDLPDNYDVVFSSEMLSHIPLRFHKDVIEKILKHSKKLALVSLKFSEIEPLEHEYSDKQVSALYVYPNYDGVVEIVKRAACSSEVFVHSKSAKWEFLKKTKHYRKVGNVIFEVRFDGAPAVE